jgi:hypothetical protein
MTASPRGMLSNAFRSSHSRRRSGRQTRSLKSTGRPCLGDLHLFSLAVELEEFHPRITYRRGMARRAQYRDRWIESQRAKGQCAGPDPTRSASRRRRCAEAQSLGWRRTPPTLRPRSPSCASNWRVTGGAEFGHSSEKLEREADQLELAIETLEGDQAERLAATSPVIAAAARRALPDHRPREDQIQAAPCACPSCGSALRRIGEDH